MANEGILPRRDKRGKLSWKKTFQAMAAADEDWSDLDVTVADGLDGSRRESTSSTPRSRPACDA